MFRDAAAFNQPLGDWDVSAVTAMQVRRAPPAIHILLPAAARLRRLRGAAPRHTPPRRRAARLTRRAWRARSTLTYVACHCGRGGSRQISPRGWLGLLHACFALQSPRLHLLLAHSPRDDELRCAIDEQLRPACVLRWDACLQCFPLA
jgi:hypothetical protein